MASSPTTFTANFLITVQTKLNGDIVEQSFSFNKREKGSGCMFDNRFEAYYSFERMLKKYSLKETQLRFIRRDVLDGKVVLVYDKNGEYEPPVANTYFTVSSKIPPLKSCEFCEHKEIVDNLNFKCKLKEKVMNKEIKDCSVFKQKKNI
jgi:hypothetical protein